MVAVLDTWLARRRIEARGACGAWRRRAACARRKTAHAALEGARVQVAEACRAASGRA